MTPPLPAPADRAILFTDTAPLRFLGVETGTRMTVVRLRDGLLVHSPIALTPELRERVDALGPVVAIVAPSKFHHLYAGMWKATWPDAVLCGCPSVVGRRPDLAWGHTLGDTPHPLWQGQLDQVYFSARSLEDEVVFYAPGDRTMICVDALFNLSHHPDPLTRLVAWGLGNSGPGATWLERFLIRDRAAARAQVDRMLDWDMEHVLLAHGPPVESGGREVLQAAYGWL